MASRVEISQPAALPIQNSSGNDEVLSTLPTLAHRTERAAPGQSWKQHEVHQIPQNNLPVVITGLMLAVFLVSLDGTIVNVALPAIVNDLGGSKTGYSWVNTSYLLVSCCLGPLYGRMSEAVGRKPVLFFGIAMFLLGSALCALAKTFIWLVIARGVQGIGCGGITTLDIIILSDITPLEKRGYYTAWHSGVWAFATIVGPLIGGTLTDRVNWRWVFWINLPCGLVAATILFKFLRLNQIQQKPFRQHVAEFDFAGLFFVTVGTFVLLLGFNAGETSWSSPRTIAYLCAGSALILLCAAVEAYLHLTKSKRTPIIPPRLFQTRTTTCLSISGFITWSIWFTIMLYCPIYFQVLGASATKSGLMLIPFAFGSCIVAAVVGVIITHTGSYRPIIWAGAVVLVLSMGLLSLLDEKSSIATQAGLLFLLSCGAGTSFHPPVLALQAAMPLKDMAMAMSTYFLIRQIGATVGLSIGEVIYTSELKRRLGALALRGVIESSDQLRYGDLRAVARIEPETTRRIVQHAFTRSVSTIWLYWTPLLAVALLFVLPIRAYTLKRQVVHGSETEAAASPTVATASELVDAKTDHEGEKAQYPEQARP